MIPKRWRRYSTPRSAFRSARDCTVLRSMHRALGTLERGGTVRMSCGRFTTTEEIDARSRRCGRWPAVDGGPDLSHLEDDRAMDEKPWFHDGLRFECTECGDCCTARRAMSGSIARRSQPWPQGRVWNLPNSRSATCGSVGVRKSLAEFENGDCVFFDGETRKCTVYEDRPRQCRTWPFWESNVRTPQAWKQTCQVCPGSGKGKLVPADQILHQVSVIRI